jgi:predicted DNA helicase
VNRILDQADVICATTTGISQRMLGNRTFDVCVIDEAGQATEAEVWAPILRAGKVILAGDHQQLPPTIVSLQAKNQGFEESMMGRLVNTFAEATVRLDVQYRMHETIMNFSSQTFYAGSQVAAEAVRSHTLTDLPNVHANKLTAAPITYIDTAGASYDEQAEDEGDSRLNPQEAQLVLRQIDQLLAAEVPPEHIAVIAPYAAQVRHLRELITAEEIEINSVDGFQGREKEAIIISLVRSNYEGNIGFLSETRRMNVALTRARRKLIVIGDSATITAHPFYQNMVDYFESVGAYKSVWEI